MDGLYTTIENPSMVVEIYGLDKVEIYNKVFDKVVKIISTIENVSIRIS